MDFRSRKSRAGLALLLIAAPGAVLMLKDAHKPTSHSTGQPSHQNLAPSSGQQRIEDRTSAPNRNLEITRLREQLARIPPMARGQFRNEEAIKLLQQWAELEPEAAIRFADQHPQLHGQENLALELFTGWLDREPSKAEDWFHDQPAASLRSRIIPSMASRLASEDPETALLLAGELPGYDGELQVMAGFGRWNHSDEVEHQAREQTYADIFREWASSDPHSASLRAMALEDPLHRNLALQEVASKWSQKDLTAALQWALAFAPGPDQNSGLQGIMPEWTSQDPRNAAASLTAMPASPERNQWLQMLGENWSTNDPSAALTWANQLSDESDRIHIVRTVLATIRKNGDQGAADYALSLPAGTTRQQGLELILTGWFAQDPEGVRAWLSRLPQASLRKEAMEVLPAP